MQLFYALDVLWRQFARRTERSERRKRRREREQRRGQQQQQREQEQEQRQQTQQKQEQLREHAVSERAACESAANLRSGQQAVNEDGGDTGQSGGGWRGRAVEPRGGRGGSHQVVAAEGQVLPRAGQGSGLGLGVGREENGVQQTAIAAADGVGYGVDSGLDDGTVEPAGRTKGRSIGSAATHGLALSTDGRTAGGAALSTGCAAGARGGVQAGEGSVARTRTEEGGGPPSDRARAGGAGGATRVGCAGGPAVGADAACDPEGGGSGGGDGCGDADGDKAAKDSDSDSDSDLDLCVEPVDMDSQSWRTASWEAAQQLLRVGSGAVLLRVRLDTMPFNPHTPAYTPVDIPAGARHSS